MTIRRPVASGGRPPDCCACSPTTSSPGSATFENACGWPEGRPAAISSHIERFRALRAGPSQQHNSDATHMRTIGARIIPAACNRFMTELLWFSGNRGGLSGEPGPIAAR